MINPVKHPICLEFPLWLEESAWTEHIPFAMFLISVLRPKTFVELGAFRGVSYCAFCQAVRSLKIDTNCYAIDTWEGDEHAGKLEAEALVKLRDHHDPLYAGFSRLVQSTFDEGATHFDDASIDLLHIDGFHSYKAVSHDFQVWLPKLSDSAVVLFHDTNVRERDFGVWKFWAEIKQGYKHFEFLHGHGLGVLGVGDKSGEGLDVLFTASEDDTNIIREFFYQLGLRIESERKLGEQRNQIKNLHNQIDILESYAQVVRGSKILRFYRLFRTEGIGGITRRGIDRIGQG